MITSKSNFHFTSTRNPLIFCAHVVCVPKPFLDLLSANYPIAMITGDHPCITG